MSESLRDSAERQFQKTLALMQEGKFKEALKELEQAEETAKLLIRDPENEFFQANLHMNFNNVFTIGYNLRNIGRFSQAQNFYKLSFLISQKLLDNDPENVAYQSYVAMTLHNIGNLLFDMGRIEDAKSRYKKALDMREKFLQNDPENIAYQLDVVMTLNNLGLMLSKIGHFEEARVRYEKALEMRQKLLENDPENIEYQSDIAMTLHKLGVVLSNIRQFEEAKGKYEKALEMRQKLLKNDPENVAYQSSVAMTLNNLGNLLRKKGLPKEEINIYEKSLKIKQGLLDCEQMDLMYQADVARTLNNLGNFYSTRGCFEESKNSYEKSLEIRQKLSDFDPENVIYQVDVAKTLNNLGSVFRKMGLLREAKNNCERALKIKQKLLDNDPKNVLYQYSIGYSLNNLGNYLKTIGELDEAKYRYEKSLEIYQKLLDNDLENIWYQRRVASTLDYLGNLLENKGFLDEAKDKLEKSLEIRRTYLKNDPENIYYQADLSITLNDFGSLLTHMGKNNEAKLIYEEALEIRDKLIELDPKSIMRQSRTGELLNNFGNLLRNMGLIDEAKRKYEESLAIYTEPMQYLTIGKKSNAIIKLIGLNSEQAGKENKLFNQMMYLKEAFKLCKEHREFFLKYELNHERKLVTEAGLSSYIDFLMKNVRLETDSRKRTEEYEKALQAVEKLAEIENDETILKLCSSAACYLRGRKLVNKALASRKPDLELLRQAMEQFKNAKETYDRANVCFCVYTALLKILEKTEKVDEINVIELKELIQKVVETLPDDVNSDIKASFKSFPQIFEEKNKVTRKELLKKLDEKVRSIEYKALENIFGHVHQQITEYFEEPFSPNVMYENWKLKVVFDDPEKVKGKLTIKAGNKTLLNKILTPDEIKSHILEIDYLENKYFPQGEEEITFTTLGQKKPVTRSIDYFESVGRDNRTRIFQCDCCNGVCFYRDLKIAAVQLKYHAYVENSVVKLTVDDAYHRKVMSILDAVRGEADIVVFPEFSIPFDFLKRIQKFADENEIIVVAGSHYVTEGQLGDYGELFCREFGEEDLRKNISPVVIPSSKIVHNEKLLGAREERELYFSEGMKAGKVNHIFKLRGDLRLGLMICYEYLNSDLRNRLISACDVILVPQTNPKPERFYEIAKADINNPLCSGNKAFVMANGIFTLGEDKKVLGGSTGIVSTLDKYSYERQDEGIIKPVEKPVGKVMEQFVLLASINTGFSPARDTQSGQVPLKTKIIHIFEENEILSNSENEGRRFVQLLETIENCRGKEELKEILTDEKNKATINTFSPLMHKHIQDLKELTFEEIKKKCCSILIPAK